MAAIGRQASDDMVAHLDGADFRADLLDHAGAFMAQNRGQGKGIRALDKVQVRVTDPGGCRADQDLMRAWLTNLDIFDEQGTAHLTQYGCLHNLVLPTSCPLTGRIDFRA